MSSITPSAGRDANGVFARLPLSLGLLRLEMRRNVALWTFPLIAVLSWLTIKVGSNSGIWPTFILTDAATLVQSTVIISSPIIAGATAWMAGRDRRHRLEELLESTARPNASRKVTLWLATVLWGALGFGVFAAYILGRTALLATWVWPYMFLPVVIALAAILMSAAIGFAIGTYLPSRFTAPLLTTVLFILEVSLPGMYGPSGALSWYGYLSPSTGALAIGSWEWFPNFNFIWARILFYLGLTGVGLGAVAFHNRKGFVQVSATALAVMVTVAGMVGVWGEGMRSTRTVGHQTIAYNGWGEVLSFNQPVPYEPVCRGAPISVCVHPAYKPLLAETAKEVNGLAAPLAGIPGVPERIEPRILSYSGTDSQYHLESIVARLVAKPPPSPYSRDLVSKPATKAQIAIEVWLMRRAGMGDQVRCEATPNGQPDVVLSSEGTYYTFPPNECRAADRFAKLSPPQQHEWLVKHYSALRAGKLTPEDIP